MYQVQFNEVGARKESWTVDINQEPTLATVEGMVRRKGVLASRSIECLYDGDSGEALHTCDTQPTCAPCDQAMTSAPKSGESHPSDNCDHTDPYFDADLNILSCGDCGIAIEDFAIDESHAIASDKKPGEQS